MSITVSALQVEVYSLSASTKRLFALRCKCIMFIPGMDRVRDGVKG